MTTDIICTYFKICDLKGVAKKAKIRLTRKLLDNRLLDNRFPLKGGINSLSMATAIDPTELHTNRFINHY